jgi:hypothetical protein
MITRRTFLATAVPGMLVMTGLAGSATADAYGSDQTASRSQSVRLTDRGIEMPDIVNGPAVDLTVRNDGVIAHELAIEKVKAGTTVQQVIGRLGTGQADPPFVLGDPGGINLLGPDEQVRYQRILQPGTYVYFVPNAVGSVQLSPAAYHVFRVLDNRHRELPEAGRTIGLGDDGITLPRLTAGAHRYAIINTGTRPHEVFIVGVKHPADLNRQDEIGAWLQRGQVGPPPVPVHFPGGHQTIDPGVTVVLTLTLHTATTYDFADFQNGAQAIAATR